MLSFSIIPLKIVGEMTEKRKTKQKISHFHLFSPSFLLLLGLTTHHHHQIHDLEQTQSRLNAWKDSLGNTKTFLNKKFYHSQSVTLF